MKVLPLLVDDCHLPPFLAGKVYGDFRTPANYAAALDHLMHRLRAPPGPTPPPAPAPSLMSVGAAAATETVPFEIKVLTALNAMRVRAADFAKGDGAHEFLISLAELGDLLRSYGPSLLLFQSTKPFLAAYNAIAEVSGKEVDRTPEELREIVVSLLHALDEFFVDVGTQALRTAYPGDRELAARILGQFGPTAADAVGPLRKALKDPSGPVRTAAAWALAAIGTDEAWLAVKEYERS